MISLSEFLAGTMIAASWLTLIICGLDLLVHSPFVLFLAKNARKEHLNHYLTALFIFFFSVGGVFLQSTLESFILCIAINACLAVIHSADQVIFEARRDLPPLEAALHSWQLLLGANGIGLYIGYTLALWSEMGTIPRGWALREFGPWAWTYIPLAVITFIGLLTHALELWYSYRYTEKINARWTWPLKKVLMSPIYWMPSELDRADRETQLSAAQSGR